MCEIFYRALNAKTNVINDTITRGSFQSRGLELPMETLYQISHTILVWHNGQRQKGFGTHAIGYSSE